jgi:hypothetical protein
VVVQVDCTTASDECVCKDAARAGEMAMKKSSANAKRETRIFSQNPLPESSERPQRKNPLASAGVQKS